MLQLYNDSIENNLSELPATVKWQNNITRLNQTNMNTLGSAVTVFEKTFKGLKDSLNTAFNNVGTNIGQLQDWKSFQTGSDGDLYKNTEFREKYTSILSSLTGMFLYSGEKPGINYTLDYGSLTIYSQNTPINISGKTIQIGTTQGSTTFSNSVQFNGEVQFSNKLTVSASEVNFNSGLTSQGNTSLGNTQVNGTLGVTGQSTFNGLVTADTLRFGVLLDSKGKSITSFDDLQPTITPYAYPYDISQKDTYENSNEIPAVKFVQSALNYVVSQIPEDVGGEIDEDRIIELIEEYNEKDAASAIVYLDTKQHIGASIELEDVYPIQSEDASLKVVSKNIMQYNIGFSDIRGITFNSNGGKYLTVSGTSTGPASTDNILSVIKTYEVPGKYTLKVGNDGVDEDTEKCYITYTLFDSDNNQVQKATKLTATPITIDTEELDCSEIRINAHLECVVGTSFGTQNFKIQVNYGDQTLDYTNPVTTESYANKTVTVYGRNLFDSSNAIGDNAQFTQVRTDVSLTIGRNDFPSIGNKLGVHYFKGVMNEDNFLEYVEGNSNLKRLNVPLLAGHQFTLMYNVVDITNNVATINNVQIVAGHTDHEKFYSFTKEVVTSNANGECDVSKLKYPYSYINISNNSQDQGMFSLYLQYDPALSRNWTEKKLEHLNNRINQLETVIENLLNK